MCHNSTHLLIASKLRLKPDFKKLNYWTWREDTLSLEKAQNMPIIAQDKVHKVQGHNQMIMICMEFYRIKV
jgi:hypothetical protein